MGLFAAGVVFLALLLASYSRRSTWIALGSTTLSMAALIGCLLLSTAQDPAQVRMRLAWVASELPLVLDQKTLNDLTMALERISTSCETGQLPGCKATESPKALSAEPEAMQAAATTGWLGSKPESKSTSPSPVQWLLGNAAAQALPSGATGFLISGTNVSDQALEEIHAVLKPDSSHREIELVLTFEGHKVEGRTVIPAGAQFSLVSETTNEGDVKQFGGAILTFRYVQAGQHKSSILYLTPSMVARFANR